MSTTRRTFIKNSALTASALAAAPMFSYGRDSILGANDRVNFAVLGVRSRGKAHINSIAANENTRISHICDVDDRYFEEASQLAMEKSGRKPKWEKDFRKILEDKDVDVITIATPEHWHAPMAIAALQAGKHVYLEKPSSHNPREGELVIEAQKKYGKYVQMGNQQRSSNHTQHIVKQIHDGLIGDVYYAKAWYANKRGSIGVGKEVPVPSYLDWELWQGPAPRRAYKDNVHPYNWHWFWHWGTGETLNNATHEVDVCRWALDVGHPQTITANGGRYHYEDDWEFYDTLITNFNYDGKMISWEGKSCNAAKFYNRGRGSLIVGTEGSVIVDRDGYEVLTKRGEVVDTYQSGEQNESMGTMGGGNMTHQHFGNLIAAIREGTTLHSPIDEGAVSVNMLLLSNIAWKTNRLLELDTATGRLKDKQLMEKHWGREYEPGWELKV